MACRAQASKHTQALAAALPALQAMCLSSNSHAAWPQGNQERWQQSSTGHMLLWCACMCRCRAQHHTSLWQQPDDSHPAQCQPCSVKLLPACCQWRRSEQRDIARRSKAATQYGRPSNGVLTEIIACPSTLDLTHQSHSRLRPCSTAPHAKTHLAGRLGLVQGR